MSFSQKVKDDLSKIEVNNLSNIKAEVSAIIKLSGSIVLESSQLLLNIKLTNYSVARRVTKFLKRLYPEIIFNYKVRKAIGSNSVTSIIFIQIQNYVNEILEEMNYYDQSNNDLLITDLNKWSYLRGCFLARGSVSDPLKRYRLEIICYSDEHADFMMQLLEEFKLNPKKSVRKEKEFVYINGAMRIPEFINYCGSYYMANEFENIRITKDFNNQANRLSNIDKSNANKIATASLKYIDAINKLKKEDRFKSLSAKEQKVAQIRVDNPGFSMNDIVDELQEAEIKISRSNVAYILSKIIKLAK